MSEFSTTALLKVKVDEASKRAARKEIESIDASVGVGAGGGGSSISRQFMRDRQKNRGRGIAFDGGGFGSGGSAIQAAQLETLNEIKDKLEKLGTTMAGSGGGGGGIAGSILKTRGAMSILGGGGSALAGAGGMILGGALLGTAGILGEQSLTKQFAPGGKSTINDRQTASSPLDAAKDAFMTMIDPSGIGEALGRSALKEVKTLDWPDFPKLTGLDWPTLPKLSALKWPSLPSLSNLSWPPMPKWLNNLPSIQIKVPEWLKQYLPGYTPPKKTDPNPPPKKVQNANERGAFGHKVNKAKEHKQNTLQHNVDVTVDFGRYVEGAVEEGMKGSFDSREFEQHVKDYVREVMGAPGY